MGLEFYYDLLSQPCRAVYFVLKCAKVDFKGCSVSLLKGKKINSFHELKTFYIFFYLKENELMFLNTLNVVKILKTN
jgi:hypothetical protein